MALSKNHTRGMIEAIKLEREQVANEIDRLFDKLNTLEQTLAIYGVKALRPRSKKQQPLSEPPRQGPTPLEEEPDYTGLTQAEAAYRYLVGKGDAVHVDEIVNVILRRGITPKGNGYKNDPVKGWNTLKQSLVSTLIRDSKRFKNIGRNHFILAEEQTDQEGLPELTEKEMLEGFEPVEAEEPEHEPMDDRMLEREYE